MSIDFDPITVRPLRRRFDPILLVIVGILAGLAIAIVKPWASSPTPEAPVQAVAVVRAPSISPTEPPTPTAAVAVAAPAVTTGLPAATWAEVAPIIKAHDQWGVRTIRVARRPSVGSPASPRFVERWTTTTPDSSTTEIAQAAPDDRSIVGLGITFPSKVDPLDIRVWRIHANDEAEWIDARPLQPADRDGSFTLVRSDPSGSARSWDAGQYRVDLLAADRLHSIAVEIPGRFESVPTPDDWPVPSESNLVPPNASDPSDVRAGLFATVDGGGVPLAAQPIALMSEEVAWRTAIARAGPIGGPVVATACLLRATGLGVMLTNHASIQLASVRRIAPDARFQASPMVGGISNTQGGTPWVAFAPRDGGAWPPGVYAITVQWTDSTGRHDKTWHVELRPGLLGSAVLRDAGGRPLG